MRQFVESIKGIFTKDTASEGESAKLLIVLRILFASIILYAVIGAIYCACISRLDATLCFVVFLAVYAVMFFSSYYAKTTTLIVLIHPISLCCVIGGFLLLGPSVSIQNFFIVLVVMCYFSEYGHYFIKGAFTVIVFLAYFFLQAHFSHMVGIMPFQLSDKMFLEFMNIFISFWCIALVCYVYSRDSQHLEGKLIEYNKILQQQACTDTLTGLHNRRSANDFIEKLINEAKSILDKIRSRIKKIEFDTGTKVFSITITYGLAEYAFDGNAEAVVKEADDKLYIGKENGRDQIVF